VRSDYNSASIQRSEIAGILALTQVVSLRRRLNGSLRLEFGHIQCAGVGFTPEE